MTLTNESKYRFWLEDFGLGSRVIITTREKHLLESHKIERTYEVGALNEKEGLELLRWKAVKDNIVDSSYEDILNSGVSYASGLPLALEVLGSNLSGKKHIEEWKSTLDQYERIPHKEIQSILKVSFDALEEEEKSVFLDIACCFKGCTLVEVEDILNAHYGQCMEYCIKVLAEKSLIKISQISPHNDTYNVTLHDLIEDMGKEIVRQESPKEPQRRSRLWFHEDIVQVLEENTGTSQIEIIYMDYREENVIDWKGDELKKMENLRTLIIKNAKFSKGPEHLPNSLRVLEWRGYPSCDTPFDFCAKKLTICKLHESELTLFGLRNSLNSKFLNLRELNFNNCRYLTQIHAISNLENLEKISFQYCAELLTVHNSVGFLNKLKILDATGCQKLRSFPPMKLISLEELNLAFCKSLENFLEILGEMKNITHIYLEHTSIEELPVSFENLTGLTNLHLSGNGMLKLPSSILMIQNLSAIVASGCLLLPNQNHKLISTVSSNVDILLLPRCNISDEHLPIILTQFANMKALDLSGNNLTIVPESIKECRFLTRLYLVDCKCLREIRGIPPNLNYLSSLGCESLTTRCRNMLLNQELREAGSPLFIVPAGNTRIPQWFEHKNRGSSSSFWFRNKFPSVTVLFVAKYMNECPKNEDLSLRVSLFINGYKCTLDSHHVGCFLKIRPGHAYLFVLRLQSRVLHHKFNSTPDEYLELNSKLDEALLKNEWIHAEVMCESKMMKTLRIRSGIHVFKQKFSIHDIRFSNPYKKRKLDVVLNN
ncbi:unnamed protein product [Trifolium pratense]|uniref:Uncharacterized protein n=1 Tax=Trifolium pratense TaxID=57577 RepID=A0ACB0LJ28_TRIPR|nr:unnamed protein product [Trifolium pratense]